MVETKKFPMIPLAHWWTLRRKFKQSIPGVITASYLATILNMGIDSARVNILLYLIRLGIVNDEGIPTERAKYWRDDVEYPKICNQMLKENYPQELLDIASSQNDRETIGRWFATHTGLGESACRRMVAFYFLLSEANPKGGERKKPEESKNGKKAKSIDNADQVKKEEVEKMGSPEKENKKKVVKPVIPLKGPGININLQIHIPSDASSDQIEQIFSSMAKHIYKKR